MTRIYNEASKNHMTYMSGRVENEKNTIPFDIELLSLLNYMSEEELIAHLNNLLKNKIKIVKGDKK